MTFYYHAKIWLAFGETFTGNQEIINWLIKNGYPEVAALSHAMRGSDEAYTWLMTNGFLHLAAFDSAVTSEDPKAYQWLKDNKHLFLIVLADACRGKPVSLAWFRKHKLDGFLLIAMKIKAFCDSQTFDYHRKRF
jgi:hypothetical protein